MITNKIPDIQAALLNVCSNDFLEPYSFDCEAPQIPNPSHHLGDINITVVANTSHDMIRAILRAVVINSIKKINKIYKTLVDITIEI